MPGYDPRIDAYIAKSAEFAQPVLNHVRKLVHETCPDVEETLKWGMPHFEYKGVMCGCAAFKAHCTFGFWKAAFMNDPHGVLKNAEKAAMGSFGKMTGLADLPSDMILKALIRDAMRLNDEGIKVAASERKPGGKKEAIPEPDYFTELLAKNEMAKLTWEGFPPSHRREYLEWITAAKTEPTREKRLAQAMQQLEEGKHRHWKYGKK
jgi:uncharacterized protein YdeI (YjbR/CyaY-like superfamily)